MLDTHRERYRLKRHHHIVCHNEVWGSAEHSLEHWDTIIVKTRKEADQTTGTR